MLNELIEIGELVEDHEETLRESDRVSDGLVDSMLEFNGEIAEKKDEMLSADIGAEDLPDDLPDDVALFDDPEMDEAASVFIDRLGDHLGAARAAIEEIVDEETAA